MRQPVSAIATVLDQAFSVFCVLIIITLIMNSLVYKINTVKEAALKISKYKLFQLKAKQQIKRECYLISGLINGGLNRDGGAYFKSS